EYKIVSPFSVFKRTRYRSTAITSIQSSFPQSHTMKIIIFLSLLFVTFASAKVFTECEVGKALLKVGVSRGAIPRVICHAKKASGLDSNSQSQPDGDGDRKHGVFHIKDELMCINGDRFSANVCSMSCDALRDDNLDDDAECVATLQDRDYLTSLDHYNSCWDTPKSIVGATCVL
uniref:lysozyme n=1 Tax=Strigamia maritima TaxID=126957 RepID=T1JE47_STRMM